MKSNLHLYCLPLACLTFMTGCGLDGPAPSDRRSDETVSDKAPQPNPAPSRQPEDVAARRVLTERRTSIPRAKASDKLAADQKPGTVREKAAVGMGEKGRGYGGDMITIPFKTYWVGRELITLDLIKHNLDLYKAGDGNGKGPRTHEEFMQKIIKANDIKLPTLPEGQRYVYDPDTEELLIERPGHE
jgi:hypothetical protein